MIFIVLFLFGFPYTENNCNFSVPKSKITYCRTRPFKSCNIIPPSNPFPLTYNEKIAYYINYYTGKAKKYYEITLGKSEKYKSFIEKELMKNKLPKELFLLPFIESGYNETAVSSAKAQGLWQLMPFTAVSLGSKVDVFIDERRNYEKATVHAIKFLNELYQKYGDWYLTLAAYNCGPGCVDKRIKENETYDFWKMSESFPQETQNYVSKFIAVLIIYKDLDEFGISPIKEPEEKTFIFELKKPVPLSFISQASGLTVEEIKKYNTELVTNITPPNLEVYNLKLPLKVKEKFIKNFEKFKNDIKKGFVFHYIKKGQTLSHIALIYSTSVKAVMLANNLKSANKLRIGQRLLIPIDPQKLSDKKKYNLETTINTDRKKYIHKVSKGESLWSISRDFNISLTDIKRWNKNINPQKLYIGMPVTLYVKGYNKKTYYEPLRKRKLLVSYSIKKGESLWLLALRYKVPLKELKRKNKIYKSTKIQIGKILKFKVSLTTYKKYKKNLILIGKKRI